MLLLAQTFSACSPPGVTTCSRTTLEPASIHPRRRCIAPISCCQRTICPGCLLPRWDWETTVAQPGPSSWLQIVPLSTQSRWQPATSKLQLEPHYLGRVLLLLSLPSTPTSAA